MRIIAGQLGGRQFESPRTSRTHPMSEKVRGALFNALGDITRLTVLDAFAGSGALSFEAVSRGALRATAIDSDRLAQRAIAQNLRVLGIEKSVNLVQAPAGAWLRTHSAEQFDLVLLDPPYDDLQLELLKQLAECASARGLIVLSLPPSAEFSLSPPFTLLTSKSYGDARLSFYRRLQP